MVWIFKPFSVTVTKIKPVTEYVTVDRIVTSMPSLPQCADFDAPTLLSGYTMQELVVEYARVYFWASNCSNALAEAKSSN